MVNFLNLRKGCVYQWIRPEFAAGRIFEVVDVVNRDDTDSYIVKNRRVYILRYLNLPYLPRPAIVEITHQFVQRWASAIVEVKRPRASDSPETESQLKRGT